MKQNRNPWGNAYFRETFTDGTWKIYGVNGRVRWALENLMRAGARGCTPSSHPAPRWSAYVHRLRKIGLEIETQIEPHRGAYTGTQARYILRVWLERSA